MNKQEQLKELERKIRETKLTLESNKQISKVGKLIETNKGVSLLRHKY